MLLPWMQNEVKLVETRTEHVLTEPQHLTGFFLSNVQAVAPQ